MCWRRDIDVCELLMDYIISPIDEFDDDFDFLNIFDIGNHELDNLILLSRDDDNEELP